MALSQRNPYIAGNLFVAREMEHSRVFEGFIRNRGTPDAVEVKEGYLRPLRVYLFYLTEGEAYLFEERSGDWIVRGPEHIPPQMMRSFLNIQPSGGAAPLAFERSTDTQSLPAANTEQAEDVRSLRRVPTRSELARKRPAVRTGDALPPGENRAVEPRAVPARPPAPRTPPPRTPATAPPAPSGNRGEESSSGDVIHRVTLPGENLRAIAQWYTGDANNTGRIARINGIERVDTLRSGQTIRIPRYLLRTTEPLPPSAITNAPPASRVPAPPPLAIEPPLHRPGDGRGVTLEDAPTAEE